MKKIFIIKSTFVRNNEGLTNNNVWSNIYAVETEQKAREDCIKFQSQANDFYLGSSYKFIYIYEELDLF